MVKLLRASFLTVTLSLLLFLGTSSTAWAAERCTGTKEVCEAGGTKACVLVNPNLPQSNVWNCTPEPTTDIKDHQSELQGYYEECKAIPGAQDIGTGACIIRDKNGVMTQCDRVLFNGQPGQDWKCKFTALSDNSRIEIDPNWLKGTNQKLFNSAGDLVGTGSFGGFRDDHVTGDVTADDEIDTAGQACGPADFLCALGKLPGILLSAIAYGILVLSTFILFLAGTVFNWVVIRTVFQFATYFGTSEGMLVAWTVLRDIANIALLFGFVFIGIATILNTQSVEGYSAKKALPRLIIFAVLLNFSLFATQGIIDVANGFASIFSTYAGQECGQAGADGTTGQQNEECANIGISGKIMSAAGMNHMFSTDGMSGTWERPYSTAAMLIILSILVSITAMVLFAASIMLVIRVVVLSMLMVTSPIGFAGLAIPSLNKIAKDWWDKLIKQAFFAPLYLLMVFISLKLLDGLQTGGASIPQALSADVSGGGTIAGNMQVVVVYAIVIGFMVGSLMVAQKMGAAGAGFATKTAGGLAFGAQGFVARRTVGRLSMAAGSAIRKSPLGETSLGRNLAGFADQGSKASFSARNLVGGALKTSGAGIDIGTANKTAAHGYHGIEEKAIEDRVKYAKSLKGSRIESDAEVQKRRVSTATNVTEAEESAATAAANIEAATLAKTTAEMNLENQRREVDALRLQVSQNPTDTVAQAELTQAELTLVADNAALAAADQELSTATEAQTRATESLAAARAAKANADAALTDKTKRLEIDSKQRQTNFANNISEEAVLKYSKRLPFIGGHNITLAGHSNHAAAAMIIGETKKSDLIKALESRAEETARETARSAGGSGDGGHASTPAAAPSGGGDAHGGH